MLNAELGTLPVSLESRIRRFGFLLKLLHNRAERKCAPRGSARPTSIEWSVALTDSLVTRERAPGRAKTRIRVDPWYARTRNIGLRCLKTPPDVMRRVALPESGSRTEEQQHLQAVQKASTALKESRTTIAADYVLNFDKSAKALKLLRDRTGESAEYTLRPYLNVHTHPLGTRILFRLRVDRLGVNAIVGSFDDTLTRNCLACGEDVRETATHFLVHCPAYTDLRRVWFTHLGRALHRDIEQVVAGAANLDDCQILLAGQAAVGSREDSMQAHDLLSIRADILGKMWERRRSLQHRALAQHHRQTPNPQHDQHTPDGAEPDIGLVISNVG